MNPLKHSSLICIYCDDLRDEVSGKTSVVGWYPAEAVALPPEGFLLVPTLCVLGLLSVPLDLKFSALKVELLQDEKVVRDVPVPQQTLLEEAKKGVEQAPGPLRAIQLRIALRLINLPIAEPCMLRMRVTIDDDVLDSNVLRFAR